MGAALPRGGDAHATGGERQSQGRRLLAAQRGIAGDIWGPGGQAAEGDLQRRADGEEHLDSPGRSALRRQRGVPAPLHRMARPWHPSLLRVDPGAAGHHEGVFRAVSAQRPFPVSPSNHHSMLSRDRKDRHPDCHPSIARITCIPGTLSDS